MSLESSPQITQNNQHSSAAEQHISAIELSDNSDDDEIIITATNHQVNSLSDSDSDDFEITEVHQNSSSNLSSNNDDEEVLITSATPAEEATVTATYHHGPSSQTYTLPSSAYIQLFNNLTSTASISYDISHSNNQANIRITQNLPRASSTPITSFSSSSSASPTPISSSRPQPIRLHRDLARRAMRGSTTNGRINPTLLANLYSIGRRINMSTSDIDQLINRIDAASTDHVSIDDLVDLENYQIHLAQHLSASVETGSSLPKDIEELPLPKQASEGYTFEISPETKYCCPMCNTELMRGFPSMEYLEQLRKETTYILPPNVHYPPGKAPANIPIMQRRVQSREVWEENRKTVLKYRGITQTDIDLSKRSFFANCGHVYCGYCVNRIINRPKRRQTAAQSKRRKTSATTRNKNKKGAETSNNNNSDNNQQQQDEESERINQQKIEDDHDTLLSFPGAQSVERIVNITAKATCCAPDCNKSLNARSFHEIYV